MTLPGMKEMHSAKRVRVRIEEGREGLFYATSPDLRGLLVAGKTLDELNDRVPEAISMLFEAQGYKVVVSPLENGEEENRDLHPWVAFPAAIAAQCLDAD